MSKRRGPSGFTLIELMMVVAIIGILSAIVLPKYADILRKSHEGASRGNLGTIRSALSIYFGDSEGQYPGALAGLTLSSKYLAAIPPAVTPPYHADSSAELDAAAANDSGGWVYDSVGSDPGYGAVWVNCTHTDVKGSAWTQY